MLSPAQTAKLYRDGAAGYDLQGRDGFLQNPYLYGPGREAPAREWWRGYQDARASARAHDPKAPS